MKLLVIDNYDSFVYNLVHIIHELGIDEITIRKNDRIELSKIESFDKILLSPGTGVPKDESVLLKMIET